MGNLIPGIRNAARALIVRDGHLLLLRKEDEEIGERYALPGGAQEAGETLPAALNRECLEEINTEVVIRDLLHVADWFKPRNTIPPSTRQRVEFLFDCTVPENYQPRNGHRPDKHQVDVMWKKLDELQDILLLPQSLTGYLMDYPESEKRIYLGTLD
ncbi:MAG: NUDIX domain-containing protein [gamma proteobacterium endosymbiont of Lamellibrachia anaximandri]|nr:NUDIX domain-containing protein [gamma proteobacterium endosymbiont of Lamellibrachia anaximandri]MBL3535238.1 NUDIX domain-containing protein [gamma proteobacterium endosymbiont of Lamellibrachia anaximandri]